MYGEVDLGQLSGRLVLLVTVERYPLHRVPALGLDEVARLHEHAARAGGGVEDDTVIRLDNVDDGLHDRRRCEELAVVVRALLGKLGEKILVDTAEHVAGGRAQRFGIECPHHLFQGIVLEALVILRQLSLERWEVIFHGFHGGSYRGAKVAILGLLKQLVVARCFRKLEGAARGEVCLDKWAIRHLTCGLVSFNLRQRRVVAVRRMPQEDQAQYGHEVLVRREVRISPQVIRDFPKIRLELVDVIQMVRNQAPTIPTAWLVLPYTGTFPSLQSPKILSDQQAKDTLKGSRSALVPTVCVTMYR